MVQPPFEIFLVPTWLRVPIWSGTLLSDEVAQLDISAKWLEPVEVCASPSTERVYFNSYDEGI